MDKITFGKYPANRKSDDITLVKQTDGNLFYGSDNEVYEQNNGNYYKIMPLEWRIIERNKDELLLLCDKIIDINIKD